MAGGKEPNLARIIENVKRLAQQEEAESREQRRRKSGGGKSMSAFSTLSGRSRAGSLEDDSVLRSETLFKQGGRIKVWRQRFFVLRRSAGLAYFENEASWRDGHPPFGRVHFLDMIDVTGADAEVAHELPSSLWRLLGVGHSFCVHTESRTYTIAAQSRAAAAEWAAAVNDAWAHFRRQHRRRDRLLGQMWRVPVKGLLDIAEQLTRGGRDVDGVVKDMFERLEHDYLEAVSRRRALLVRARCFTAWKFGARHLRAQRQTAERRASMFQVGGEAMVASADRMAAQARRNGGSFFSKRASAARTQLGAMLGIPAHHDSR